MNMVFINGRQLKQLQIRAWQCVKEHYSYLQKEGNIVMYEGTKRAPNYEKGTFELQ